MDHLFNDIGSVAQIAVVLGAVLAFLLSYEHRVTVLEASHGAHMEDITELKERVRALEKAGPRLGGS